MSLQKLEELSGQEDHKYLWNSTKWITEITVLEWKKRSQHYFHVAVTLFKTTSAFHVRSEEKAEQKGTLNTSTHTNIVYACVRLCVYN